MPMDDAVTLAGIEAIKTLKARYCRYLDHKDWAAWRPLFADEFVCEIAGAGGRTISGAEDFVAYTRRTLGNPSQRTVHHVHAPEISLSSPTTAHGVWALADIVRLLPAVTLYGYGHYHETYEKRSGRWYFTSSTLTRLHEVVATPLGAVQGGKRLRTLAAKLARARSTTLGHERS
jgi:hypothetical protein